MDCEFPCLWLLADFSQQQETGEWKERAGGPRFPQLHLFHKVFPLSFLYQEHSRDESIPERSLMTLPTWWRIQMSNTDEKLCTETRCVNMVARKSTFRGVTGDCYCCLRLLWPLQSGLPTSSHEKATSRDTC